MPPSHAVLGGFAIGARVTLLWQHNANPSYYKLASIRRYDDMVRTRNVSECSVLTLCLVLIVLLTRVNSMGMGDGGGRHWLVRTEWRPAGRSVCLPLLIFPCTIKSRSSLLAPAHSSSPGKRAEKPVVVWCGYCDFIRTFSSCHCLIIHTLSPYIYISKYSLCGQSQAEQTEVN